MKRTRIHIQLIAIAAGWCVLATSCVKNLLDQLPTTELADSEFWKTEKDAKIAIMGAYADVRPLFDREYYWDGLADYQRTRGTSAASDLQKGNAYPTGNWNPASPSGGGERYDNMFRYLYGGVNRTNYVIENVKKMIPNVNSSAVPELERIMGEARLLRGMVYFRLISLWGDVPYFTQIVTDNNQVSQVERMPIKQIKDSIYADLTYAYEKLPLVSIEQGRATKAAALGFRGKLMLYWACWNKFGWPELEGFQPSPAEATDGYTKAAADLKEVSMNMGLSLFRNGEPGEIDEPGKADKLPNYYYLFTPVANDITTNKEFVMYFTHGGTGTNQGEELMRDVAGRSHEGSQCWITPRYEIADRYQLLSTGDFAPPLIPLNPTTPDARTRPNSALNPQSYANRDYRMKSSIMWDFELSVGFNSLKSTGFLPFIYNTWNSPNIVVNGIRYDNVYNTDGCNTGYVYRKFLRNTAGLGRSEGNYSYPIMRLADVFLMYAEASNAIGGPNADAIELVNKIRRRAALPDLGADKYSSPEAFFNAIEQERIVELLGEGQRFWDLRRWRALERIWGPPNGPGRDFLDTHGEANTEDVFQNQPERAYQRAYIFRIPPAERERNPKLTQNTPWL